MRWSPRVDIEPANDLPADACRVARRVAARRSSSRNRWGCWAIIIIMFFCDALACWMRVCSGVHARVREQSDRRSRVASTRKRKRHRSVQSGTRSEATPVTRVLRPPDKSVQSEPEDASASGVCSIELSTRSCLASEPTAQGTGAVARVSSEGRGFHGGLDRRVCVERKLETPAQAGALKCLPPVCLIGGPETQTKRARPAILSQTESRRWQRQHGCCDTTWKGAGEGAAATEAVDCCCCTMRYRKFSTIFSNPTQRCEAQSEEV